MKHFLRLTCICLFLTTNCVNAQIVTFLTENFNAGFPATWTRVNNDGLTPNAAVSFVNNAWVSLDDVDSLGMGDSVLVATSYYSPAGTADDWLISPAVTLIHNGNFLTWQAKSQDPSYPDGYEIRISNSLPVIDSFYTKLYDTDGEFPTWTDGSVSLDTFVNQTVYIAFRAKSNDKFLLLLDNIKIYADSLTSVNEINYTTINLNVYPNPAGDFTTVTSDKKIQSAKLFDVSGKLVSEINPFTYKFNFSLLGINPGIYILNVICTDGTQSQIKIIRS